MNDAIDRAEKFNGNCDCMGTDLQALRQRLDAGLAAINPIAETHPHLFADVPVFITSKHASEMQRVIDAVEGVVRLPAFLEQVLARAPSIARRPPSNLGVFFGFDFHITPDGPKLIEINTNAGGALLNVELQREQQACCPPVLASMHSASTADARERGITEMFSMEWKSARGDLPLGTVAIVDDSPHEQFLFPEFLLFKRLFEARGVRALIADAHELSVDSGALMHEGQRIDLVYNRCTDFYFADSRHAALAEAYANDLAVITPHPHAHAVYSAKDNLVWLSDAAILRSMNAAPGDIDVLARCVPQTLRVAPPADRWWDDRRQWFFKPLSGFGGRGVYRGDKITRRVFGDVMRGDYIAQQFAPPSERRRRDAADFFKLDVRNYVYDGKTQLMAARLYQGQTTNFRTAGGGFAPVYLLN